MIRYSRCAECILLLALILYTLAKIHTWYRLLQRDFRETLWLSLPIIAGRFGAVTMGVIDNMMVGNVGYQELAAAGISNSVVFFLMIIPIGVLIVGSPMISGAKYQYDFKSVSQITKSCIQWAMLLTFGLTLLLIPVWLHFDLLGQTPEVTRLAMPYFALVMASMFPLMFFVAVEQLTDGLEQTGISMFFNISALGVNAGLNWIFIYGHFGMPALGLLGAGLGTLLARSYMAVGIWMCVRTKTAFKEVNTKFRFLQVDQPHFGQIWKTGIPSGFLFFFEVSAFSIGAVFVGWLGDVQLAAHNVVLSIASVTYMMSSGLAMGGSIRVGKYAGMSDMRSVRRATTSTLLLVVVFMSITCVSLLLWRDFFVSLYNSNPQVLRVASGLMVIAALFQLSDGVQIVTLGALRALKDVNIPALLSFISYCVLALPLGYLLAFGFRMDVMGIWIGFLAGLLLSSTILTLRLYSKVKA